MSFRPIISPCAPVPRSSPCPSFPLSSCPSVPSYLPALPSHHISMSSRPPFIFLSFLPPLAPCLSVPSYLHVLPSHHISMSFRPIISPCLSVPSYLPVLPSHHITLSFRPIISPCPSVPSYLHVFLSHHISMSFLPLLLHVFPFPRISLPSRPLLSPVPSLFLFPPISHCFSISSPFCSCIGIILINLQIQAVRGAGPPPSLLRPWYPPSPNEFFQYF